MESVYIETSVFGYLTSRPHRDIVVAGHQATTREWWANHRQRYELVISTAVLTEIGNGDPTAASERLEAAAGIDVLMETGEVRDLASLYLTRLRLPPKALIDAYHIAFAVAAGTDFLATWNMTHIANADIVRRLVGLNQTLGRKTPLILTVESLIAPRKSL